MRISTTTRIRMTMHDTDFLTLTQWMSATFPIGAFGWSHGLEQAIRRGDVETADDLKAWLQDVLTHGAGRSDAILLAHAHAATTIKDIADLAAALAPSAARRAETLEQGAAFAAVTRDVWGLDVPDMAYPVAVGRAAGLRKLSLPTVLQFYLQGFAGNLVQAALRLMPLGQTAGQRVLSELAPQIVTIAAEAERATLDDIGSAAFAVDTAAMQHETAFPRIFRS